MCALRLAARWVLPIEGPPIEYGAVLVGDDGLVAAVGPDSAVPRPPLAIARNLGEAALLPGLVNTHSHLELTALRGLIRERPFDRWVAAVRRVKDALTPADFEASARWGVLEGFAAGITTTGDTGSTLAPARAMAALGARGVAYHEVFGPDPAQLTQSMAGLDEALVQLGGCASDRLRIGVSPHAPYTVSAPLLAAVAARAAERGLPFAMHVAESRQEHEFVLHGTGPFAAAHERRGISVEARGMTPVAWALASGLGAAKPLFIHCVSADEADFRAMRSASASVAHCPWSNNLLGNGRADLAGMRSAGLTVGLGTDSVASGGSLDLFAEARLAASDGRLGAADMLRLITRDAARALGVAGAGVIVPGGHGDLVAVRITRAAFAPANSPEEVIAWTATAADVLATWVAGRQVFSHGQWPQVDANAERNAVESAAATARAAARRVGG